MIWDHEAWNYDFELMTIEVDDVIFSTYRGLTFDDGLIYIKTIKRLELHGAPYRDFMFVCREVKL